MFSGAGVSVVSDKAVADRVYGLVESDNAAEALRLIEPLSMGDAPSHDILAAHSAALKAAGRPHEAEAQDRRAIRLFPESGIAWHNLAATLCDLGRGNEAVESAGRAFALGLDRFETWTTLARAQILLGDHAAAADAYREAIRRRPTDAGAARELAGLIWMTTGDADAAVGPLREARAAGSTDPGLAIDEARLLKAAARLGDALHACEAELARRPNEPAVLFWAADTALDAGDGRRARAYAARALEIAPRSVMALTKWASVALAEGWVDEAFAAAVEATRIAPLDQSTWAWLATAARATGHPVHQALFDYQALVRTYRISTPPGWTDLADFLAELSRTLQTLHRFKVEPADQTLRLGTQTAGDLALVDHPVLKAFFAAVEAPIRSYLAEVSTGRDPLRSRNTGRYRIESAWSVRLRPHGFHVSHYHPKGWISSAFYVETPDAPEPEGWLKFGEPPTPTRPPMPPERFVRPEPGLLALFPSYMWHGTMPFSSGERRLTIAFDLAPG
jgi:tetratricopeptide (TPR) repeat protein